MEGFLFALQLCTEVVAGEATLLEFPLGVLQLPAELADARVKGTHLETHFRQL